MLIVETEFSSSRAFLIVLVHLYTMFESLEESTCLFKLPYAQSYLIACLQGLADPG